MQPQWAGQESVAFPDNWSIGLSFYHNLFAREHNSFVDEFRRQAALNADRDSGLRNPSDPKRVIRNQDVTPDELFEVARLVVAAEIAKIHTIEWTPQLLYDEPLYKGMNANWNGLLGTGDPDVSKALSEVVAHVSASRRTPRRIAVVFGLRLRPGHLRPRQQGSASTTSPIPNDVNGGVNHFGSPFNFPEEFVTVYRLHPLVPDLIEYRDVSKDPNQIVQKVAVIETFEGKATDAMRSRGLANWGLSMGRQRLGLLTLHNHPQFLQNIKLPRLDTPTQQIDIAALDLIRDREHGVPRFNEFRRQYGLRQLTSYDDFMDQHLPPGPPARKQQEDMVSQLREVYGTHVCDASKVITDAQVNEDGTPINDCLGHPNGSVVDNIEDVDTVVGWLAESTRPHGFAISETQFVVFILNASRRLFSDRFFTSSFRPEFYTQLGIDWVNHNGPGPEMMEAGMPNGHKQPVSPLKRHPDAQHPGADSGATAGGQRRSIPGGAIAGSTTRWIGSRVPTQPPIPRLSSDGWRYPCQAANPADRLRTSAHPSGNSVFRPARIARAFRCKPAPADCAAPCSSQKVDGLPADVAFAGCRAAAASGCWRCNERSTRLRISSYFAPARTASCRSRIRRV